MSQGVDKFQSVCAHNKQVKRNYPKMWRDCEKKKRNAWKKNVKFQQTSHGGHIKAN